MKTIISLILLLTFSTGNVKADNLRMSIYIESPVEKKIPAFYFKTDPCMSTALNQISILTNFCYQQLLTCGVDPSCTAIYNNTINAGFAYIENVYNGCAGLYNGFVKEIPPPVFK